MGADVEGALEQINVPSYVLDNVGVIRWMNLAARRMVGDQVGRQFTSVVAPHETRRAQEIFARRLLGKTDTRDTSVVVLDDDGGRIGVEISSVPLKQGDRVIGVFGQVSDIVEEPHPHPELHLSRETVRNHVRHLLHAVGATSRLEAVAVARGRE